MRIRRAICVVGKRSAGATMKGQAVKPFRKLGRSTMRISALLGLLLVLGCQGAEALETQIPPPPSEKPTATAPQVVTIDGTNFYLEVFAWRDFMPSTGPSTSGLLIAFEVTADTSPFPRGITADIAWAVHMGATWTSAVEAQPNNDGLSGVVRNGPEWPVDDEIDFVLRLIKNDEKHPISARGVKINATF